MVAAVKIRGSGRVDSGIEGSDADCEPSNLVVSLDWLLSRTDIETDGFRPVDGSLKRGALTLFVVPNQG